MVLDRTFGQVRGIRDLPVRMARQHAFEHLELPLAEFDGDSRGGPHHRRPRRAFIDGMFRGHVMGLTVVQQVG